ncbi:MAG: 50S ribosomal protein L15 [Candidatus Omnitrophica bacterium]|nr:50S ribosomal protein L15 [Candidatus Omnitrophota bacterium]MBU2044577.1 50S ribosomal protein L15 [Candidatus Omnitrophota bacterium]MBU2251299.1 50S ribosomal protein L15 [Candidatus Omnitrophota bacterium]MBU2266124.1 50S ribosomal protein L15 [Candidatus Omnitrophota bacterium]MBU2474193.1 50S ribosomal protein L15 [Candidatus Omnitrophota bacterium]
MNLSDLRVKVKNKKPHRLGRGTGSGSGKTSGRGHKGAGQRKGKVLPYIGFRGGNLPFARTLPKRGFTALRPKEYQLVNLCDIQKRAGSVEEITPEVLEKLNLIKDNDRPVKILAKFGNEFKKKAKIKADAFSAKAKELIESQGGVAECLNR